MNGYEKLTKDVKRDCENGQNCFNPNGCDHEFGRKVPMTDPYFLRLGLKEKYMQVSKCTHKYCDKFKWILDRAQQYADKLGTTRDEVLDAWENNRDYWYMNYYQESNQPSLEGSKRVIKYDDWLNELKDRYGNNVDNWKFVCPACGHVQSSADFKAIGVDPNRVLYECIERYVGNNDNTGKKACNYNVNSIINIVNTYVINNGYFPVKVFDMYKGEMKVYRASELSPMAKVVPVEQVRKVIGRIVREELKINPNDPRYKELIENYMNHH